MSEVKNSNSTAHSSSKQKSLFSPIPWVNYCVQFFQILLDVFLSMFVPASPPWSPWTEAHFSLLLTSIVSLPQQTKLLQSRTPLCVVLDEFFIKLGAGKAVLEVENQVSKPGFLRLKALLLSCVNASIQILFLFVSLCGQKAEKGNFLRKHMPSAETKVHKHISHRFY